MTSVQNSTALAAAGMDRTSCWVEYSSNFCDYRHISKDLEAENAQDVVLTGPYKQVQSFASMATSPAWLLGLPMR